MRQDLVVATGGTDGWQAMIRYQMEQVKRLGYEPLVFDLGGLGFGEPLPMRPTDLEEWKDRIPRTTHKARMASAALDLARGRDVCMLDGDSVPVRELDLSGYPDFDVAVVIRTPKELGGSKYPAVTGYVSSATMFFRPTPEAREWLDCWDEAMERLGNDQWAANELIAAVVGWHPEKWTRLYDRVVKVLGAKILFLRTVEWNWYYEGQDKVGPSVRVVHYGKKFRKLHPAYRSASKLS